MYRSDNDYDCDYNYGDDYDYDDDNNCNYAYDDMTMTTWNISLTARLQLACVKHKAFVLHVSQFGDTAHPARDRRAVHVSSGSQACA